MKQKVEPLSLCASPLWWGEATDEPAREDARPTSQFMAPMRVQSWRLKLSMSLKFVLLEINDLGNPSIGGNDE